jgi:hypothetical protein
MNYFSKKFFNLALFFGVFLQILLLASNASAQACPPNQVGCTQEAVFNTSVVPKGYPSCTLTISYKLRVCQGEFQIYGLTVTQLGTGCTQFLTDVLNLFLATEPNAIAQGEFVRTFFRSVYTQIGDQFFQIAVDSGPAGLYFCDNPNTKTFIASFYNGSCVSLCVGRNSTTGSVVIDPITCGSTCCKYKREYCIDPKTGEKKVVETTTEVVAGNCIGQTKPGCTIKSEVTPLFQGPCLPVCSSN